jgi:hypothetical protein
MPETPTGESSPTPPSSRYSPMYSFWGTEGLMPSVPLQAYALVLRGVER